MYKTTVEYHNTDRSGTVMSINGNLINHLPVNGSLFTVNGKDYTVDNVVHDYTYVDGELISVHIWIYCIAN